MCNPFCNCKKRMNNPQKVAIAERASGSVTAPLLPMAAFLKAQGNPPAPPLSSGQQEPDGFHFDRDRLSTFLFEQPLDGEAVKVHFDFPSGIGFTRQGDLWDSRNRVGIMQSRPASKAFSWK